MNVYPITFHHADGTTSSAELVTDMTLTTKYVTLALASNGVEYSAYPGGNPPNPTWTNIQNLLSENAPLSINILTTYVTPTTGVTLALNGTLPAGWAFNPSTNLLTYDGNGVSGAVSLSFTATLTSTGNTAPSNTFSVSGIGSVPPDVTAPTVPLGVIASAIAQTTATISGFPSSDPSLSGATWSGLGSYHLTVPGVSGSPFAIASAAGNKPILAGADIGTHSAPSTFSQSGADVTITTYANSSYSTADVTAAQFQQLSGTGWVLTCRIDSFADTNSYAKAKIGFRSSLAPNDAYISLCCNPQSQGLGVNVETRASAGAQPTASTRIANSTFPLYLMMVQTSATAVSAYVSFTGNLDATSISLGSFPFAFPSTFYGGVSLNTDPNYSNSLSVTFKQLNIQNLANWSKALTGLTANTTYSATVTATDGASNVSAASSALSFTTPAAVGAFPTSRSKLTWPFSAASIWNTPIGSNATWSNPAFNPTADIATYGWYFEPEYIICTPTVQSSPYAVVARNLMQQSTPLDWNTTTDLCAASTTVLQANVPLPDAYIQNTGVEAGQTKANCGAALLLTDGLTVVNTQQFARCTAGSPPVSGSVQYDSGYYGSGDNPPFSQNIKTGDGRLGAHGGSHLSSLGGSIRRAEINGPIYHALKAILPTSYMWGSATQNSIGEVIGYSNTSVAYTWPAQNSDSPSSYAGTNSYVKSGSLLAINLSASAYAAFRATLESPFGAIIADACYRYGVYIVDTLPNTKPNPSAVEFPDVAVEPDPTTGAAVSVDTLIQSQYGHSLQQVGSSARTGTSAGAKYCRDLDKIWSAMQIVTNNTPTSVGGGGTGLMPPAPAFSD